MVVAVATRLVRWHHLEPNRRSYRQAYHPHSSSHIGCSDGATSAQHHPRDKRRYSSHPCGDAHGDVAEVE